VRGGHACNGAGQRVSGHDIGGHHVLRAQGASVPKAIAAFLLYLRDATGQRPYIYFG